MGGAGYNRQHPIWAVSPPRAKAQHTAGRDDGRGASGSGGGGLSLAGIRTFVLYVSFVPSLTVRESSGWFAVRKQIFDVSRQHRGGRPRGTRMVYRSYNNSQGPSSFHFCFPSFNKLLVITTLILQNLSLVKGAVYL